MEKLEYIPINIWSDFYDDGYVPEGKKQETYIYIEDTELSHDKRKECLEILLRYMGNLDFTGTKSGVKMWMQFYESRKKHPNLVGNPDVEKMFFDRWEIRVENLTHMRLELLIKELDKADLSVNGIPFHIYSES